MSRAFVKDADGSEEELLPELLISPHRNLVTVEGLSQIEATVARLQSVLSEAREAGDRAGIAQAQRDLRYWTERLRTAEAVPAPAAPDTVRFGVTLVLQKLDGERVEYRIVGEDEAHPAQGRISYVSPIAKALIGKSAGDVVALVDGEAEVLEIR